MAARDWFCEVLHVGALGEALLNGQNKPLHGSIQDGPGPKSMVSSSSSSQRGRVKFKPRPSLILAPAGAALAMSYHTV